MHEYLLLFITKFGIKSSFFNGSYMVKDLLFYSFAAAAMLIPTAVGAQEEEEFKLYPTSVDIYGDAMGQFADDKISKRTVTFYDQ